MKLVYSLTLANLGGYTFSHVYPELSATFIKIFTDVSRASPTPQMSFKLAGDHDCCVFTVTLEYQRLDLDMVIARKILERNVYYSKYIYGINNAQILINGVEKYKADLSKI